MHTGNREPADRWLALLLLTLIYAISSADRLLMSLFIEPIKAEFRLSDSGVSFVTALVFGTFYVGASIPLGVLGDRGNQRRLLALCALLFSCMTALTGFARSYGLMLASRVGVAIGEAGFTPIALAFLASKFAPKRRYAVFSLFSLGITIGGWAGGSLAGHLEGRMGWRTTMVVFGLAGLPMALALRLLLRDSHNWAANTAPAVSTGLSHSFRTTLRECITRRSVFHTIVGAVLSSIWGWGLVWWIPAFFYRSFGTTTADAGAILGMMHGVVGTTTILLTAVILIPLARSDARRPLWLVAIWCAIATVPSVIMILAPTVNISLWMLWLFIPASYATTGPIFATISAAVEPNMRSQVTAICLAVCNLAAMAIAPQLVGFLSDLLAPHMTHPNESLRYALLPLGLSGFWGAAHFWLASRHVRADSDRVTALSDGALAAGAL